MTKTAQAFIDQYNGKVIDYDGVYGAQCVDGFKIFCKWIGAPVLPTKTGWADGYWYYNSQYADYVQYIHDPNKLKKGDWLFWAKGSSCKQSHVGMFVSYAGNGCGTIFGQNQGGNGGFTTVKIRLDILGAFRFNALKEGTPMWKKNSTGWWYERADGSYPANAWEQIDDKWYHFNKDGYMETGWIYTGKKWYFLKDDGAMATGWINDKEKWYYLNDQGAMQTGWIQDKNKWYYFGKDGAMFVGKHTVPVYFDKSGVLIRKG